MKKADLVETLNMLNTILIKLNETLSKEPADKLTENYRSIFNYYISTYPEKKDDYIALVNMYNGSYRRAVIAIECERVKQEIDSKTL